MLVTSMMKSYDGMIYPTSGLIVPMSLFAGTYFPLDQLPFKLGYVAYVFPLTHSVSLLRGLLLTGISWWQALVHILFLIIVTALLIRFATRKMTDQLIS
jgi:lipooligosaccharide transport system permease protein